MTTTKHKPSQILDVPFADATDVRSIRYRIAPIDVGYDLREHDTSIAVRKSDDPIRVSYAGQSGDCRVMEGPQAAVLRCLQRLGYRFSVS